MNHQGDVMDRKTNHSKLRPAYNRLTLAIALVLNRWPHYSIGGGHA